MITKEQAFPNPLLGKFVGKGQWELTSSFDYKNPPVMVIAPIGFVTDGASIPKFAHPIVGPPWGGPYSEAAVIHDFLYYTQTTTRWEADKIFYDAMKILKVSPWKRSIMHFAVRIAGWIPWKKKRKT